MRYGEGMDTTTPADKALYERLYATHGQGDHARTQAMVDDTLAALTAAGYVVVPRPKNGSAEYVIEELRNCAADALSWASHEDPTARSLAARLDCWDQHATAAKAVADLRAVLTAALDFAPAHVRSCIQVRAHAVLGANA